MITHSNEQERFSFFSVKPCAGMDITQIYRQIHTHSKWTNERSLASCTFYVRLVNFLFNFMACRNDRSANTHTHTVHRMWSNKLLFINTNNTIKHVHYIPHYTLHYTVACLSTTINKKIHTEIVVDLAAKWISQFIF